MACCEPCRDKTNITCGNGMSINEGLCPYVNEYSVSVNVSFNCSCIIEQNCFGFGGRLVCCDRNARLQSDFGGTYIVQKDVNVQPFTCGLGGRGYGFYQSWNGTDLPCFPGFGGNTQLSSYINLFIFHTGSASFGSACGCAKYAYAVIGFPNPERPCNPQKPINLARYALPIEVNYYMAERLETCNSPIVLRTNRTLDGCLVVPDTITFTAIGV